MRGMCADRPSSLLAHVVSQQQERDSQNSSLISKMVNSCVPPLLIVGWGHTPTGRQNGGGSHVRLGSLT
jgi:hypothetical protein